MKLKTRMILIVGLVLLVVLGGTFAFIFYTQEQQTAALLRTQALAIDDCIDMMASTVSKHGGIWVEEKDGVGTNPYLAKIPGLTTEIVSKDNKKYALMNGFAFIQEMTSNQNKIGTSELNTSFKFRAPTDKALNPLNQTTVEEQKYLDKMRKERLAEHSTYTTDKNGKPLYIHSRASVTDNKVCVEPCHMNYKVGAIDSMNTVTLPIEKAVAMNQSNLRNLCIIFLTVLIIVLSVLFMIARYITAPINELVDAANRISKGETDVKIDIKRNDEVGELAKAFNRMSASLKILSMTEQDLPKTGS